MDYQNSEFKILFDYRSVNFKVSSSCWILESEFRSLLDWLKDAKKKNVFVLASTDGDLKLNIEILTHDRNIVYLIGFDIVSDTPFFDSGARGSRIHVNRAISVNNISDLINWLGGLHRMFP